MCKWQQAGIIYAYQSFKGGKVICFGPGYFKYKIINSKGFWFFEGCCFPEKNLLSENIKVTTAQST